MYLAEVLVSLPLHPHCCGSCLPKDFSFLVFCRIIDSDIVYRFPSGCCIYLASLAYCYKFQEINIIYYSLESSCLVFLHRSCFASGQHKRNCLNVNFSRIYLMSVARKKLRTGLWLPFRISPCCYPD